ncbi:MAG: cobalamin biosynthesis protein CobQ [Patescibacteria group bacterium]
MNSTKFSLTIGWLYPDLMSTYGDRGNIVVLSKIAKWNNIDVIVKPIDQKTLPEDIKKLDFIFGGGSQDTQQEIVMRDLMGKKGAVIKELIEHDIPALFVCGSPQIMGNYYEPAMGKKIEGLSIFDMHTINPGPDAPRCIGNIVAREQLTGKDVEIVGFENHGGRTFLGKSMNPFAKVVLGFGNNGEDGTEGVIYKNAVGCYFHGPLLSKNPSIAAHLLQKAIGVKYNEEIACNYPDTELENNARKVIIERYSQK